MSGTGLSSRPAGAMRRTGQGRGDLLGLHSTGSAMDTSLAESLEALDRALKAGDTGKVATMLQAGGEPESLRKMKERIAKLKSVAESASPSTPGVGGGAGSSSTFGGSTSPLGASGPKSPMGSPRRASRAAAPSSTGATVTVPVPGASSAAAMAEGVPLRLRFEDLQQRYDTLQEKYDALQAQSQRAMETNIERVRKLNEQIADLQNQLKVATTKRSVVPAEIIDLNGKIKEGIEAMQQRTARVLKEHELDLVRSFRTRLLDVQRELHVERSRQDEAALEWIEKAQTLTKKLDWAKEEALRLDGLNQLLTRENNRLRTQFQAQEGDRQHLVAQVVALKRELARYREENQQLHEQLAEAQVGGHPMETPQSPGPDRRRTVSSATPGGAPHSARSLTATPRGPRDIEPSAALTEAARREADKWKDEVRRLRKVLELERKNLRKARASQMQALSDRTELQAFLRQCISDVQAEILMARRMQDSAPARAVDVAEFSPAERARVLEILLSKERVVSLLYERTFPSKFHRPSDGAGEPGGAADTSATDRLIDQLDGPPEEIAAAADAAERLAGDVDLGDLVSDEAV